MGLTAYIKQRADGDGSAFCRFKILPLVGCTGCTFEPLMSWHSETCSVRGRSGASRIRHPKNPSAFGSAPIPKVSVANSTENCVVLRTVTQVICCDKIPLIPFCNARNSIWSAGTQKLVKERLYTPSASRLRVHRRFPGK